MKIGFIGLGNVGGKLAGSLLRNGMETIVLDLDEVRMADFAARGASTAQTPAALTRASEIVITCLPSPAASAAVLEAEDGVLGALRPGQIWVEMSTTDADEITRLAGQVAAQGAAAADAPVSGGCHRADTGNIAIFVGATRETFETLMPVLSILGREILHTGPVGSASTLKVITNYLATAHLLASCEALTTAAAAGLDLATAYEGIRISSGNSFSHETESQVILNGSRDISFTMDLVLKDIGLFQAVAERAGVPLELNPKMIEIFEDGARRYGPREWSPNIIRRLEDATGLDIRAPGFPAEMSDTQPEGRGAEIRPAARS